ncbi:MAG: hypothetical protein CVU65_05905 [Deltaproteobacteria bacterium HGW-Deltaproteobacteria-22]|jgi:hypothetical protein|nr:MAG: hypothetical protein CVU65_05905 [Deltaproteobacteria bacterium HGW-Deltaproteobacteria-22]
MKLSFPALALSVIIFLSAAPARAGEYLLNKDPDYDDKIVHLKLTAEMGFVAPLYHKVQFGDDGTYFDYVEDGGQGILFPFMRFVTDVALWERHHLVFLYQPLEFRTVSTLPAPLRVSGTDFAEGEAVRFKYGFSFWRASYVYDLLRDSPWELGVGGSLQIRNASITFESLDGTRFVEKENVGPVPALKVRLRRNHGNSFFWGLEADGLYTSNQFINGASYKFTGAILDASAYAGFRVTSYLSLFLNVRYLGGGAEGTSGDREGAGDDGVTRNWLNTATVTLGVTVE